MRARRSEGALACMRVTPAMCIAESEFGRNGNIAPNAHASNNDISKYFWCGAGGPKVSG